MLLITMHHIVSDGWSMGVLMSELSALYEAYRAREQAIRCRSWRFSMRIMRCGSGSGWRAEVLQAAGESTGRSDLAGAPALLELPTDHARPAQQDYAGGRMAVGAGREAD